MQICRKSKAYKILRQQQTQPCNYLETKGHLQTPLPIKTFFLPLPKTPPISLLPSIIEATETAQSARQTQLYFLLLSIKIRIFQENVSWASKMRQNPPHSEASSNAKALAQQGTNVSQSHTIGCSSRTRSGLCRDWLQEICGSRDVPEPPHL